VSELLKASDYNGALAAIEPLLTATEAVPPLVYGGSKNPQNRLMGYKTMAIAKSQGFEAAYDFAWATKQWQWAAFYASAPQFSMEASKKWVEADPSSTNAKAILLLWRSRNKEDVSADLKAYVDGYAGPLAPEDASAIFKAYNPNRPPRNSSSTFTTHCCNERL